MWCGVEEGLLGTTLDVLFQQMVFFVFFFPQIHWEAECRAFVFFVVIWFIYLARAPIRPPLAPIIFVSLPFNPERGG